MADTRGRADMPDPNPIAGLYPQPQQQPPQNALANNPGQVLGMVGQMRALQGQQSMKNALQGAIGADGSYDPNAALTALKNDPNAWVGQGDVNSILEARTRNITNSTMALSLGLKNNEGAAAILAPYAASGKPLTKEEQFTVKAKLAAAGIDPATVQAADLNSAVKAANAAKVAAIQGAGPAAAASPIAGPPGPNGEPTAQPLAANIGKAPTPYAVANPPGYNEAAGSVALGSAGAANTLTAAADTSPTRKGMLGNLEGDLKQFTTGQGADWQNVAKNWANRNVLPSGMQFDPKSIASQEEFNKQAEQLAQQQFAAIGGTGTDAKFGSAFKANPHEVLSQLGNKGIIRLLKGNEDAIQAKNAAWQDWVAKGNSPASYPKVAAEFNKNFDPRVYQSQYMSKDDFHKMVGAMSGPEYAAFKAKMDAAKTAGHAVAPGKMFNGD